MHKSKQWLTVIFRWFVAIGLLIFILNKTDSDLLWQTLRGFNPVFGLLLVVCHIAVLMLMAYRWRLIAQQLNVEATYADYLKAIWIGALSGQIGPPLIFSEVARFKVLQDYGDTQSLIGSQVLDRLSGLVALVFILLLTLPINWPVFAEIISAAALLQGLAIVTIAGAVLFRTVLSTKIRAAMARNNISDVMSLGQSHYELSSLIQLLLMLGFLLAAYGLGDPKLPFTLFTLLPLIFAGLTLLPISISDWGTREMFSVYVLSFAGLPAEESAAISIIFGFTYLLTTLLGLLFLLKK
ncbi:lysylphosphatidylglycerol synthase transmembrane domain-containing protein [Methylotuvimicrobium buryatense]|uniref:Flippase-like domain-containing protein n=1 Tax=Methylotuvimicrobium buryatense TaxID=95641 RepID=A0A4V1IJH6_METBY|nr:lysylphosphatidylglycerol synthase transmembrane domain-containing protein [Methylotuvimicrobium buryatense]QCW81435.1 flippase-like domain-containing protein [Methylotuvimicrobium buryatense]